MECWETRDLEVEFFQLARPAFAFILMLIRSTHFIWRVTSYFFANPARPRPKRTLGGTNCRADRAPVRSSMSSSCASSSSSPVAASGSDLPGAFLVLLLSWPLVPLSSTLARRRDPLDWLVADDLRR